MKSRIKSMYFDARGVQQMIINTLNLIDSENVDYAHIPIGLAGEDMVIRISIEPRVDKVDEGTTGLDIPYDAREECLGKLHDTVTIKL